MSELFKVGEGGNDADKNVIETYLTLTHADGHKSVWRHEYNADGEGGIDGAGLVSTWIQPQQTCAANIRALLDRVMADFDHTWAGADWEREVRALHSRTIKTVFGYSVQRGWTLIDELLKAATPKWQNDDWFTAMQRIAEELESH